MGLRLASATCLCLGQAIDVHVHDHSGHSFHHYHVGIVIGVCLTAGLHGAVPPASLAAGVWPEHVMIPMRDGKHLSGYLYYPVKGEANGIDQEPPVRYYVMGAVGENGAPGNVWRDAQDWPPAAQTTAFHLQENGRLTAAPEAEGRAGTPLPTAGAEGTQRPALAAPTSPAKSTTCTSNPLQPMIMPGRGFLGARDAREFEGQSEVRTWTAAPLEQPVETTGEVTAEIS